METGKMSYLSRYFISVCVRHADLLNYMFFDCNWLHSNLINPAETFGDIVIDYPYVECTSAAIQALTLFKKLYPGHRSEEIKMCISKAAEYIEEIQASDGSWYGSWGVCFTYAGWFGIKGLVAAGRTYKDCSNIRKACDYLLSKELPSGGWGESYLSCQKSFVTYHFTLSFVFMSRSRAYSIPSDTV
ncbi:Cycloartenol synthase [Morella rubra]|uniref:Cycloartenol synthase n=1 Tax=Morella rubra TaxID=262757 RepID=A0A6A1VJF4_9ROSI|nr:Cycloartenol synthase [Morella rubra]